METIEFKPIESKEALAFESTKGQTFVVIYHDKKSVRFSPIKRIPNTDVWKKANVSYGWPIDYFQERCAKQFTIQLKK